MFRYQDNNNYYRFSWNGEQGYRQLEKRVNGVFTVLAEDAVPFTVGQTYRIKIVAERTSLQAFVDGKLVFQVADRTFNGGTVALFSSHNDGAVFDDVLVEDLPTNEVLLWDDFNDGDFKGWAIIDDEGTIKGPSEWTAAGGALIQSSNVGFERPDFKIGTYALY
jgi:hypothetical protein